MSFGLEEARIRLNYINQHREITLGVYVVIAVAAWVLGAPVPHSILTLLFAWFALCVTYARMGRRAQTEPWLHHLGAGYFLFELLVLTLLAYYCGGAGWLGPLFFTVTILYANLVLPPSRGLGITLLAGTAFSAMVVLEYTGWLPHRALFPSVTRYQNPHYLLATLLVAIAGFWMIGYTSSQFSRMLGRKSDALEAANEELKRAGHDLLLHKLHLEDLVRQRTGDLARAYDDLWQAHRELQRLNELKTNFLANVSHELRTPLTSIRSFSEILLKYPDEKIETRTEFLGIIINESNRLTRLINNVLDLAKIEAGGMEWRLAPVHLAEVAARAVEVVRAWAEQSGLRLLNEVAADLPAISGDADRLHQVFTNLLGNAVKFTHQGHVRIGSLLRGSEVIVFVNDSGTGIAAAELDRIFEKFHQHGDSYTGKPDGTGLGLTICREIVQHLGGRIWAESEPGQGSTFYCSFPASENAFGNQRAAAG